MKFKTPSMAAATLLAWCALAAAANAAAASMPIVRSEFTGRIERHPISNVMTMPSATAGIANATMSWVTVDAMPVWRLLDAVVAHPPSVQPIFVRLKAWIHKLLNGQDKK